MDGEVSARLQAVFTAWSWFRQSDVVSSRPPAGIPLGFASGMLRKRTPLDEGAV